MLVAKRIILLCLIVLAGPLVSAWDWQEEIVVTSGESPLAFATNTRGSIGMDSSGRIHLVYGAPDNAVPPSNQIFYQLIDVNQQVSSPIRIDNGSVGGGKHPSLAIDEQDTVHVVWHDYRHTTSAGNYIDNIEIYYDKKVRDGSFSQADIRLTATNAGHQGDNGYAPQITVGSQNRLYVAWYDYTRNGNNAEIYLIHTDESGHFPMQEGIESFRMTNTEHDPNNYPSHWLPDLAALPNGSVYIAWGFLRGWQGAFELQGLSVNKEGNLSPIQSIAPKGGRFNDPARLIADAEGNLALVYAAFTDGQYRIILQYKPLGGEWRAPIVLNDETADASQPCAAFLSPRELLVAWQEDLAGFKQIAMAQVDPAGRAIVDREILSQPDREARTPAMATNPITRKTAVAWIEKGWNGEYSIEVRSTGQTHVAPWFIY
ncbi:hypothetical protein GF373_03280 [bacterium]|nr:hypothetical protein [bacterium]